MPKTGTKVWMIIEPVGVKEDKKDAAPASAEKKPDAPKAEAPAAAPAPTPVPSTNTQPTGKQ